MTGRRLRVSWLPGSDTLLGSCFCGVSAIGSDPQDMWDWLRGHPEHGPVEGVDPQPVVRDREPVGV